VKKVNLKKILTFLQKAEKQKSLLRHSWLSSGRQESVAEHSWRVALFAMLLAQVVDENFDIGKVLKMIIVHDLGEIYAGDHHAWKPKLKDKTKKEKAALLKLTSGLPADLKNEIVSLWQEYEARKTREAKFAKSIDKLETIDQHNLADIKTWVKEEYKYQFEHGKKEVEYSRVLSDLRKLINSQSRAKMRRK